MGDLISRLDCTCTCLCSPDWEKKLANSDTLVCYITFSDRGTCHVGGKARGGTTDCQIAVKTLMEGTRVCVTIIFFFEAGGRRVAFPGSQNATLQLLWYFQAHAHAP
jgi:hypothetical protein